MIHPIESAHAHAQTWMSKHFEKTAYGRELENLKNIQEGKRCFLIGNGPSLRAEDLTCLYEHGEICFAFNRIYNIFEQTPWRPTMIFS